MKLRDSQQLLWRLITAPEGVARALADTPLDAARLADTVAGNSERPARTANTTAAGKAATPELGPVPRLNVYAEAYFARIHGALQSDFCDLAAQLGENGFHDLVTSYLAICPPKRPSLRDAGERLPDFLSQGAGGEPFRRTAPWAPALAQLEWTQLDLFDAADSIPATRKDFEALPAAEWGSSHLQMIPAARLLALDWPVHELCASWPGPPAQLKGPNAIAPAATQLLVWRSAETVSYRPLKPDEAKALTQVSAGTNFGTICEQAAAHHGEQAGPTQAATWLTRWLKDGLLAQLNR